MSVTTALESIWRESPDDLFGVGLPNGTEIIFRLPPYRKAIQYYQLLSLTENREEENQVYEYIFKSCVQDDFMANKDGELEAGIPTTIAKIILSLSGLDSANYQEYTEQLFKTYRKQFDKDPVAVMRRTICTAFSGYTLESLDNLNYQRLVEVFIQAEKILLQRGIIEEEHNFSDKEVVAPKKVDIDQLIKEGEMARRRPDARMQQLRQVLLDKAKKEEAEYYRRQAEAAKIKE